MEPLVWLDRNLLRFLKCAACFNSWRLIWDRKCCYTQAGFLKAWFLNGFREFLVILCGILVILCG